MAKKDAKSLLEACLAGGISGGIEICITYPTEYVKTQLQLQKKIEGQQVKYNGVIDCVKKTVKDKGVLGLYRGLSPLLYMNVPKVAARFWAYELAKKNLQNEKQELSRSANVLAGLFAGVVEAVTVVTPMETLKVKFIDDYTSAKPKYRGFFHGISTIVKEQGLAGVYRGMVPTVLKQGTNQMIRFFVYGEVSNWFARGTKRDLNPLESFISGAIAGAASVFGNTPIDVVKTRMQGLEASKYKNSLDCAYQILKKEGVMAFYSGTIPRLGRVCMDVGIIFTLYGHISRILHGFGI